LAIDVNLAGAIKIPTEDLAIRINVHGLLRGYRHFERRLELEVDELI